MEDGPLDLSDPSGLGQVNQHCIKRQEVVGTRTPRPALAVDQASMYWPCPKWLLKDVNGTLVSPTAILRDSGLK